MIEQDETSRGSSGAAVVALAVLLMLGIAAVAMVGGVFYFRMERRARQAEAMAEERLRILDVTAERARAQEKQAEAVSRILELTKQARDDESQEPSLEPSSTPRSE